MNPSKYISKVISEAKKCAGGVFHGNTYSGTLSVEAIAADLFKGKIYDESEIEEELEKTENAGNQNGTEDSGKVIYFGNKDKPKNRCEKKARDPYQGVYDILRGHSRRLVIDSKKMDGNIFEKIFYSILYPW